MKSFDIFNSVSHNAYGFKFLILMTELLSHKCNYLSETYFIANVA